MRAPQIHHPSSKQVHITSQITPSLGWDLPPPEMGCLKKTVPEDQNAKKRKFNVLSREDRAQPLKKTVLNKIMFTGICKFN